MADNSKKIKTTVKSIFTTTATIRTTATATTNKTVTMTMDKERLNKFTLKQESFKTMSGSSNAITVDNLLSAEKFTQKVLSSSPASSSSSPSSSLVNKNRLKKFTQDYSVTPKLTALSNEIDTKNQFTNAEKLFSIGPHKYVSPYTGNVIEVYKELKPITTPSKATKITPMIQNRFSPQNNFSTNMNFSRQFPVKNEMNENKNKKSPGICYIFNHENFDSSEKDYRIGSINDVKLLEKVFAEYNVKTSVFTNLTLKKIKTEIKKIENGNFSKYSCIVIVILSHGNRYEKIKAKDGIYSIDDDILFPILTNKTLNTKPKIFIVQACKGSTDPRMYETDSGQNSNAMIPIGTASEVLKCYSTFEGFVAFRNSSGSIFIKVFCNLLHLHGRTKDIKQIMDMTISEIKTLTNNKQIPSYNTTLTKSYVFGDYV